MLIDTLAALATIAFAEPVAPMNQMAELAPKLASPVVQIFESLPPTFVTPEKPDMVAAPCCVRSTVPPALASSDVSPPPESVPVSWVTPAPKSRAPCRRRCSTDWPT